MVQRLFVEKRTGFDIEARAMLSDIKETLGFGNITALRLFNRYDVEGLSGAEFDRAAETIFSEATVDTVYAELPALGEDWKAFVTEYLPGQYDQRADSAAQCIQLLTQGERPVVASAKVIALQGITEEQFTAVQQYLVNPVESRIAAEDKPDTLATVLGVPADVATVTGFTAMTDAQVAEYHGSMGFAMTAEDLCFCRDYFKSENRDPSVTELRVIDTYWSDHCRHTTFLTKLEPVTVAPGGLSAVLEDALQQYLAARTELFGADTKRNITLMDMGTIGAKLLKKHGYLNDLDESEEINACSIQVPVTIDGKTEEWLIQFKNETHNHPTEIEPFGGAATCLGGAIRDPLSGRAYVYQAMRVTGAADPTLPFEQTMAHKLPQKKITTGAAAGYSSYGNQIGLATGQVTELYHPGYVAKRLEIGAVVGASPKANVVRGVPSPGDVIVLLGGRTGRDGCGGATGSSKAHDSSSIETCGAEVQKGNPPTERKLQRLFRNPDAAVMIKRCNDFGAGGVCVAIGELADALTICLDDVPKKYEGLDGTELAISESQERMAVVLEPKDVDAFIALAAEENLEATPVAKVTNTGRLVMLWRGKTIVDLSRAFLNTNGVTSTAEVCIHAPEKAEDYRTTFPTELKSDSIIDLFKENLGRLNVCAQKGLSERFDASIGAGTVLMPFAGAHQLTPEEAMVAKVSLQKGETDDATAMAYGFIPEMMRFSPFHGAIYSVLESLAKLAAVGADTAKARLTFQEYFERLGKDPARWGKPAAALLGAFMAQKGMGTPSIGGKDSMSGSFNDIDVPPTLVSFAISMTKASKTGSAAFANVPGKVYLIDFPVDKDTLVPDFAACKDIFGKVAAAVQNGNILAAGVVKEGGAAAAMAKMAFGNQVGLDIVCNNKQQLFAPLAGAFVVQVADALPAGLQGLLLANTTCDGVIRTGDGQVTTKEAADLWKKKLEPVFPLYSKEKVYMGTDTPLYSQKSNLAPAIKVAKPRVLIPVFPGTNCEVDTARAFERAGADPHILVVRNLTPADIEQTVDELERQIRQSQIIMLPGGFSGGDEPDGSGKFIATFFRGERIRNAVQELLNNRDGLMLGICNGFQALIKLGLVPYGEIRDQKADDPTLTFNTIGRHISRMVQTRVTSNKSPWLSLCEAGELHTVAVSHGEGRFVAPPEVLRALAENGQIATQYVDLSGNPTADMDFNPNGSACAIEGITSPDGRVLGKMGHSERMGNHLYKNVPGEKDQKIFAAGVRYFK